MGYTTIPTGEGVEGEEAAEVADVGLEHGDVARHLVHVKVLLYPLPARLELVHHPHEVQRVLKLCEFSSSMFV